MSDDKSSGSKVTQWVKSAMPRLTMIDHIRNYPKGIGTKDKLVGDLSAGIVVAVMLIPQGLAYASLAGLEPVYGLYASIAALLVYPFFGTSPQLAVGPSAVVSILTAAAVVEVADVPEGSERYHQIAFTLAFLSGIVQVVMSLVKAGYLVNFLSHPVLKGFTSAAAIIIGVSQVGKLLGFKVARSSYVWEQIYWIFRDIDQTEWRTLLLALENLFLFFALGWLQRFLLSRPSVKASRTKTSIVKSIPNALIVVFVNIVFVYAAEIHREAMDEGVAIVGDIASGYPSPVNIFSSDDFGSDIVKLAPTAIIMSLVGFMESISVAKAMALKFGAELESNAELMGLGSMNLVGAFFNGFPVTGGFSRTIVNAEAGAKTPLAGMISAVVLILVCLFLTNLFYYLPEATLGALIVFAVTKLVEFDTPMHLWRVDRRDFFVFLFTFVFTILLGIEPGIIAGAAISLARVLQQAASPHAAVLGRKPGTNVFRNVKRFPTEVHEVPGIKILRFDAQLFFGNAAAFQELMSKTAFPGQGKPQPLAIVVDCGGVGSIDSSAMHTLDALGEELQKTAELHRQTALRKLRLQIAAAREHGADSKTAADGDERSVSEMEAALQKLQESPVEVPRVFFACMRGPVRDMMLNNKTMTTKFRQRYQKKLQGRLGWCAGKPVLHSHSVLEGDEEDPAPEGENYMELLMQRDLGDAVDEIVKRWLPQQEHSRSASPGSDRSENSRPGSPSQVRADVAEEHSSPDTDTPDVDGSAAATIGAPKDGEDVV